MVRMDFKMIKFIEYKKEYEEGVLNVAEESLIYKREDTKVYIEETMAKPDGTVIIAVEDKKVLGLARITFTRWNMVGNVGAIGVSKGSQGKGVGKGLMKKAEEWFLKKEVRKVYVDTAEDNIQAQIFYIKCGYFPEYSMKDYYRNGLSGINFSKYIK